LEAHAEATIDDAAFAVACLEALAGPNNLHAVTALRDMAERASADAIAGHSVNSPFVRVP
jgi:hypothetical protein